MRESSGLMVNTLTSRDVLRAVDELRTAAAATERFATCRVGGRAVES
jgi:hypothetical protein